MLSGALSALGGIIVGAVFLKQSPEEAELLRKAGSESKTPANFEYKGMQRV